MRNRHIFLACIFTHPRDISASPKWVLPVQTVVFEQQSEYLIELFLFEKRFQ